MTGQTVSDWLVTFLVDSSEPIFSHDPYCMGAFEFSYKPEPFPECEHALVASAQKYSIVMGQRQLRVRTFFLGASEKDSLRQGRQLAKEALILFDFSIPFPVTLKLLGAGCMLDLSNRLAKPIVPGPREHMGRSMGPIALLDDVWTHPTVTINSLLSTSPETYGELGSAVRRSTHWSHLASQADDYGERILLLWMAAETLTRVGENESLTPKLTAAAGFPTSRYYLMLPHAERAALLGVKNYKRWTKKLKVLFDKARLARNSIAHAGFRELDLGGRFSQDEQLILRRLFPRVVGELQRMSLNALQLGIRSVREMWIRFGDCFLMHRGTTLAHYLEGNVLFSLAQPEDPFDD